MTQVHFTLNSDEIQKIIHDSVQDDLAKDILTTIFNQLMEDQRSEYKIFLLIKSAQRVG